MTDERDKQVKYHLREALRLMENIPEEIKPKISPKKTKKKIEDVGPEPENANPQNTPTGISWAFHGNQVLFKVPFKYKDGFKKIIAAESKELAKWEKDLKVWKLHEDQVTESLLDVLRNTHTEWFDQQREEHRP